MKRMFQWTIEAIDALKALHAEGKTRSEIGAALGVSRSAVSGKIDRLNLPKRGLDHTRKVAAMNARKRWDATLRLPRSATAPRKNSERKVPMLLRVVIAPESRPVPLMERTGCCYPTTVDGPHLFCDLTTEAGAYCEFHQRVMYPKRRAS